MNDTKNGESPIEAAASLGRLLPQVASGAVALSILCYIVGWREAESYYSTLGAPWAATMLSPVRLLQESWLVALPVVLASGLSIEWLSKGDFGARRLGQFSVALTVTAGPFMLLPLLPESWVAAGVRYSASLIGAGVWGMAVGFMVGMLIGKLSSNRLIWTHQHVSLLSAVLFLGLITLPSLVGRTRADRDLAMKLFPKVALPDFQASQDWRLVEIIDGSALLVDLSSAAEARQFRLVDSTDPRAINTTRSQ